MALNIGGRRFSGSLQQPAFMVVRLEAGAQRVSAVIDDFQAAARIVLTPLADDEPNFKRFAAFEKRVPKVGVHLGFRRDCGSSLIPHSKRVHGRPGHAAAADPIGRV